MKTITVNVPAMRSLQLARGLLFLYIGVYYVSYCNQRKPVELRTSLEIYSVHYLLCPTWVVIFFFAS